MYIAKMLGAVVAVLENLILVLRSRRSFGFFHYE